MAIEADKFQKRIVEKLAWKRGTLHSKMASFVRKRIRFDLTKRSSLHYAAIKINLLLRQLL